jgi:hypothetical protein
LEQNGDRDWFRITLTAGVTYEVDLRGIQTGAGTLEDPYLRLYDNAGANIAENDDIIPGTNRNSQLTFQVAATGTYYIEAGAFGDNYLGTYTVSLSVAPRYEGPHLELGLFGPSSGGWSSQDTYPRHLADVNGDGMADIVGFGSAGVFVSLATGSGHFGPGAFTLAAFGSGAGGWSSNDTYPRELADVNGDGKADIIGFGTAGVYVSLATGGGNFTGGTFELSQFGSGAGGWTSQDTYTRHLGDVNGDGMADIIGFGSAGVYVALASGGGHFDPGTFKLAAFGSGAGGWSSDDTYPRMLADVNGDGKDDIVGFGSAGVYVALASGGGNFSTGFLALSSFGAAGTGWSSQDHYPRYLADINHDGRADIVGFGESQISVALGQADGSFAAATADLAAYTPSSGGWTSNNLFLRQLGDVDGDGNADIIGFGSDGVYVSRAQDHLLV